MIRKIYNDLLKWKDSQDRKPLLLKGARQVGKTYIVNLFGSENYANVVYCNFEQEQGLKDFFINLNPKEILTKISVYKKKEILPEHTLIIFDEIQSCPEALTSLKYFCEETPSYHVIAISSLLGVAVKRQNFPFSVEKVEFLNMYPMDFEEFLFATDNNFLVEQIKKCFNENKPIDRPFHKQLLDLFKTYLYVGGMPEVVDTFIRTNNVGLVRIKQNEIIAAYFNDMSKYNKATDRPKTSLIYKNISRQLAKENKKFQYSLLKSGARASSFEDAVEWICSSKIASQLYKLKNIKLPLEANKSIKDFKFYMNDVGLCCASQNIFYQDILLNIEIPEFMGGLTENYVYNQLKNNGLQTYYWTSKYDAEVDFVVKIGNDIIPIEIKARDSAHSKSLNVYVTEFKPNYAIRVSTKNFGFENNIKSVPLYAVFCI